MKLKLDKFRVDLFWNMVSFLFVAILGVFMNAFISKQYDVSVLGVFNQNYALYLFLSQLAVSGVHLSVQKYIPEFESKEDTSSILISALLLTTVSSLLVILVAYFFRDIPGRLMDSEGVKEGFKYVIPGLLFFSYNKVLLAYLNGRRRMKEFALYQFLRFFLMVSFLVILNYYQVASNKLVLVLTLSEITLFLIIILAVKLNLRLLTISQIKFWLKNNFHFGNRALLGNFLFDANTKVDIFLIGIFLSDRSAGIYSFAALILEGFAQVPVIFRNNINPVIAKCYSSRHISLLNKIIKVNIRKFYKVIGGLGILSIIGFPVVLWVFGQMEYLEDMWIVYSLLVSGIIFTAGYQPFIMLFNQMGNPALQTWFIFALAGTNFILNLIFIPMLGIYGSALATGLSNIVVIVFIKYYANRKYKLII